jgi:hypothetical protein
MFLTLANTLIQLNKPPEPRGRVPGTLEIALAFHFLTSEPDQTGNSGIPPVRPEWAGRVCCGLAVRAYSQNFSMSPIGMSCDVHGSRYWITADNVLLP